MTFTANLHVGCYSLKHSMICQLLRLAQSIQTLIVHINSAGWAHAVTLPVPQLTGTEFVQAFIKRGCKHVKKPAVLSYFTRVVREIGSLERPFEYAIFFQ